jgi:hypothetical protein
MSKEKVKIYVSHSRNFNYKKELYAPLKKIPGVEFIFPHEDSELPFETKSLFPNKGCDFVLAEVSHPSTGQGIELGWADLLKIPIICVYKQGSKPADSLQLIAAKLLKYKTSEDLQKIAKENFNI